MFAAVDAQENVAVRDEFAPEKLRKMSDEQMLNATPEEKYLFEKFIIAAEMLKDGQARKAQDIAEATVYSVPVSIKHKEPRKVAVMQAAPPKEDQTAREDARAAAARATPGTSGSSARTGAGRSSSAGTAAPGPGSVISSPGTWPPRTPSTSWRGSLCISGAMRDRRSGRPGSWTGSDGHAYIRSPAISSVHPA
jgi:hypothetical protein